MCSCIWWKSALSVSFDKKAKLLTCLTLLSMIWRTGFLSYGHTRASFQDLGKCPASNDLSMIVVMTGRRASHLLTKREGIGSSGQDFNVEFWISDLPLLADRILNADNDGVDRLKPSAVVNAEAGKSIISASICLWIVSIFDTIYFPTSLAKVGARRFRGNSSPCDWLNRLLLARSFYSCYPR